MENQDGAHSINFNGSSSFSPSQSRSNPFAVDIDDGAMDEIDEFLGTESDDTGMTARVLLMLQNPSFGATPDLDLQRQVML